MLGGALYADSVAWWENVDGDGAVWTKHVIDAAFDEATALYAADVNGDGRPDALSAAAAADEIAWWQNHADQPIPTVSEWGMVVMALFLRVAGTLVLKGRRQTRRAVA
ncbi:MAG: FG-GAP-like repeat-containing protein [Phycisphaerae bacterium]